MVIKKIKHYLPVFIPLVIKLFLIEFLLLNGCRLVFYFAFRTQDTAQVGAAQVLMAFVRGFEFDMVISTYALILPILLLWLNNYFFGRTKLFHNAALVSTIALFGIYALVSAADFPYFNQFRSHLNRQAFLWADSPGFVIKLILGTPSYYAYAAVFLLLLFCIYRLCRRVFNTAARDYPEQNDSYLKTTLGFVVLLPFVVLGARGRLALKSTSHEGRAIVSDNLFINQVALNPNYTLFRSLFFQKVKPYSVPADINESIAYARRYFGIKEAFEPSVRRMQKADSAFRPYNVVIVCMESMSAYKTGLHGRENLTPYFNNLIRRSVLFDRFFSSGIHTFNGLFSTCAAYPNTHTEHSLRRYTRKSFSGLARLLGEKNYQTYFFSTHDPYFDNMQGFFTLNGYKNFYSSLDLPEEKNISATGVPDHEIFEFFINVINKNNRDSPFLGFIMTGSDHGPWAIPKNIPFKPGANSEEKRSTQYADWSLGHFMELASKQSWYKNTLFVFLGDHGYATEGCYEMPLSYHHTPFVLHMPGVLKADTNHNVGYQPDLTPTVAGVLNLEYENNTFGINLLKEKHPFVFFTADDKTGCVDNEGYFYYELIEQNTRRLRKYINLDQNDYFGARKQKADSMAEGTRRMLDAAEYFLKKDYFSY